MSAFTSYGHAAASAYAEEAPQGNGGLLVRCASLWKCGIRLNSGVSAMSPIKSAGSVEIQRRNFLAAAAVGLAFGTSSLDALGQEATEKGQASVGEIVAGYAANLRYQ